MKTLKPQIQEIHELQQKKNKENSNSLDLL